MDATITEILKDRRDQAGETAHRSIDRLRKHLDELEAGITAWERGEAGSDPKPYGNAFGDAASDVSAFREASQAHGHAVAAEGR